MSDLPASHYAKIYRRRISAAERGITHPSPSILAESSELLAGLEKVEPNKTIKLEEVAIGMLFKEAESGGIVGRLTYEK